MPLLPRAVPPEVLSAAIAEALPRRCRASSVNLYSVWLYGRGLVVLFDGEDTVILAQLGSEGSEGI